MWAGLAMWTPADVLAVAACFVIVAGMIFWASRRL